MNAARAATTEVREARRNYERKLVLNIDTDRKSFYAYVYVVVPEHARQFDHWLTVTQ